MGGGGLVKCEHLLVPREDCVVGYMVQEDIDPTQTGSLLVIQREYIVHRGTYRGCQIWAQKGSDCLKLG